MLRRGGPPNLGRARDRRPRTDLLELKGLVSKKRKWGQVLNYQ